MCDTASVLMLLAGKPGRTPRLAFQGRAKVRVQSFPLSVPKPVSLKSTFTGNRLRSAKNGFHADRWRGSHHIESFLKRFQTQSYEIASLRRNVAIFRLMLQGKHR